MHPSQSKSPFTLWDQSTSQEILGLHSPQQYHPKPAIIHQKRTLNNPVWALVFQIHSSIEISPQWDLKVICPEILPLVFQDTMDNSGQNTPAQYKHTHPKNKTNSLKQCSPKLYEQTKIISSKKQKKFCQALSYPQQEEYFLLLCIVIFVSFS